MSRAPRRWTRREKGSAIAGRVQADQFALARRGFPAGGDRRDDVQAVAGDAVDAPAAHGLEALDTVDRPGHDDLDVVLERLDDRAVEQRRLDRDGVPGLLAQPIEGVRELEAVADRVDQGGF